MGTLDNTKIIIIIVVTSVIGVIAAATIIVVYFLLRGRSEKDIHRDTEKVRVRGPPPAPPDIEAQPANTLSNQGTLSFTPHDSESLSTLTQTVTLGPSHRATHIVSLDQWVGNTSKLSPTREKSESIRRPPYHKPQSSDPRDDDDLRISVKKKQVVPSANSRESYLSAGSLSQHEESHKRRL